MTTAAERFTALRDTLAGQYPARLADRANRQGRPMCVVEPVSAEYTDLMCDPSPVQLTGTVLVLAAMTGEQAVADLLTHADPVAALIRDAGWTPTGWVPDSVEDLPALAFTAVTNAQG
jgi:hypothetical protein